MLDFGDEGFFFFFFEKFLDKTILFEKAGRKQQLLCRITFIRYIDMIRRRSISIVRISNISELLKGKFLEFFRSKNICPRSFQMGGRCSNDVRLFRMFNVSLLDNDLR